jgi:glycosyltransferase involved in cell wall biosynthesis
MSSSTPGSPRVTVLMAVFNGAEFVRAAIDSILAQSFADFEFLIVDDGSSDDTQAVLASYEDERLRIVRNPQNVGLTRSLNIGIARARGEYIARQDADDLSHVRRLERQIAHLDAHQGVVVLGTQARYFRTAGTADESVLWWKITDSALLRLQSVFTSPFFHTSVMFRTADVRDGFGGYSEEYRTSQDFELWSRLMTSSQGANLAEYLVDQRTHAGSISSNYNRRSTHLIESVLQRNLQALLGERRELQDWARLWCSVLLQRRDEAREGRRAFLMLRLVFASYRERYPQAARAAEFRLLQAANALLLAKALLLNVDRYAFNALAYALRAAPVATCRELGRVVRKALAMLVRGTLARVGLGLTRYVRRAHP